ncbi:glycosyltransferase family 4 protein [Calothrix sp. PCC 7507]|uniref:glycosyltransferase family 4 protein n=1 Tax=Calothrix sp. PCC 7507 TaxID=99598 RepID=UPI00029EDFC7|nr:glycosyltransferase [Calothrix sp. PCC 7507]AFY36223.1 glycosyl transferase group 1 [Calothrix sp. PCC 7507]
MKILLSAYSCEPGRGSEPGVGWNFAREIARHHEVWVLTRTEESQKAIEAELARNPVPNLHFVYFTTPIFGNFWKLGQSGAMQIHYYFWQITAYFVARRLHQEIGFDVVQHVTFVKYSGPSFLSLLPIPFVWGPVGGGESAPKPFWQAFNWKNKVYEILRILVRSIGENDPFTLMTARRSAVVYSTTEDTAVRVKKMGCSHVKILSESGLSQQEIDLLAQVPQPDSSPVRFISMARLLHWKGIHLGLQAFAQAKLPDAEYWIVGDGAEFQRLQNLAASLGIAKEVKFWGRLPRQQTLERLGECHVLVHPSLHDSGGWVCLEAMAAGRPVICLDLGGPAQQVTAETGFKILANNVEQTIADMAAAMVKIAGDAELRVTMGEAGQRLIRQNYTWEAKGQLLSELYAQIVACS